MQDKTLFIVIQQYSKDSTLFRKYIHRVASFQLNYAIILCPHEEILSVEARRRAAQVPVAFLLASLCWLQAG